MNKPLLLVFMLLTTIVNSQWTADSNVDPFEGDTKTVIATGYGGESPYTDPYLVFRERKGKLQVYVGGAGSLACEDGLISFSWGDPEGVIKYKLNESQGGGAGFFEFDPGSIEPLINKLKKESMVYVKFETRCSVNRFRLNLRGSTAALNTIFTEQWYGSVDKWRKVKNDLARKQATAEALLYQTLNEKGINQYYKLRVLSAMKKFEAYDPWMYIGETAAGFLEIHIKSPTNYTLEKIVVRE